MKTFTEYDKDLKNALEQANKNFYKSLPTAKVALESYTNKNLYDIVHDSEKNGYVVLNMKSSQILVNFNSKRFSVV